MKVSCLSAAVLFLTATALVQATTVTLAGTLFEPNGGSDTCQFRLRFDYDESLAPTVVQEGELIGWDPANTGVALETYYLFSTAGVTNISGWVEGMGSFTGGVCAGNEYEPGGPGLLLFNGDIRQPGAFVDEIIGSFGVPGLRFDIGGLWPNPDGALVLSDVFVNGWASYYSYNISVARTPEGGSLALVFGAALFALVTLRNRIR